MGLRQSGSAPDSVDDGEEHELVEGEGHGGLGDDPTATSRMEAWKRTLDADTTTAGRFAEFFRQRPRLVVAVAVASVLVILVSSFTLLTDYPAMIREKAKLPFLHGSTHTSGGSGDKEVYYNWNTTSSFDPVHINSATSEDLCAAFPTHLLNDIQIILKTGHGVLTSRVRPQLAASLSCIPNLLLFSDTTETFAGHNLTDVVADTPTHLLDSTAQLDAYRRLRDSDAATTSKEGWKMDKFKFLPSAVRAWNSRPQRQWYVFLEADTYMLWDTLFRLLPHFDADEAFYFGSPSPGREGTWFANGGPGFVLSRGAMRRLLTPTANGVVDGQNLIEAEWDHLLHDCCGDSVLGWALHARGVGLSGLWPLFNPHAPTSVPFGPRYWCQPVLSLHKPGVEEYAGLWAWEGRRRVAERPLLYRDLAREFYNVTSLTRREGWTNAAWDDLGFDAPPGGETVEEVEALTAASCEIACEEDEGCFSWTHHGYTCSLVYSIRIGYPRFLEGEDGAVGEERDMSFVAGWMTARIGRWVEEHPCEDVQWVKPSVERVF